MDGLGNVDSRGCLVCVVAGVDECRSVACAPVKGAEDDRCVVMR